MTTPLRRAGLSLAAVASCLLAAGCKSSTSSSSSTPAASTQPGATVAAKATATCNQLTKAQVQPYLVDPITGVSVTPAGTDGKGQTCAWASKGSSDSMAITVLSGDEGTNTFATDVQSLSKPVSVPGVGDKADRDGGDDTEAVSAIKGNLYCRVVPGDGEIPGTAALEEAAGDSSNIGDANYALEAAAAGTLCNVIFGSGTTTPDFSKLLANAAAASAAPASPASLPTNFAIPTDSGS
jgi:hypothetical protein